METEPIVEMIWVEGNLRNEPGATDEWSRPLQGQPCSFWDRDERHPVEEVFITGPGKPVQVALTKRVDNALRERRIVRVDPPQEAAAPSEG